MKSNPLISIIIPVYNGENYIKDAINSALNQTYRNIEVIVVDDGPKDSTANIIKAFKNRVIYIIKFIEFGVKNDNVISKIAWWISVKKCCKNFKSKFQIIIETMIYVAIAYTFMIIQYIKNTTYVAIQNCSIGLFLHNKKIKVR